MKVVIFFNNVGPYHMARLRTANENVPLLAIQLAASQRLYSWHRASGEVKIETLSTVPFEDEWPVTHAWRLVRRLMIARPTHLFVPGYATFPALVAALFGRLSGCCNVLMSESNQDDHVRRPIIEALKRVLVRSFFDAALVGGTKAAAYARILGIPARHISFGYNVVDNERFRVMSKELKPSAHPFHNEPYLVYVGRFAPEKNLALSLRAFSEYRRRGGRMVLALVGAGPLEEQLKGLVSELSLENYVRFVGSQIDEGLVRYFSFSEALLLPSTREPWGLVVNEALACGIPVLASNRCGCVPELVHHGWNGLLFDPTKQSEIVDTLLRFDQLDQETKAIWAQNSRMKATEFEPSTFGLGVRSLCGIEDALDR